MAGCVIVVVVRGECPETVEAGNEEDWEVRWTDGREHLESLAEELSTDRGGTSNPAAAKLG